MRFDGKTVLVTGASSGIGKATALLLGQRGARVIVAARRTALCQEVADDIVGNGGAAVVIDLDLADPSSIDTAFARIGELGRLDGAFNNAGVSSGFGRVEDMPMADIQATIDVNFRGTLQCIRHEVRLMRAAGGGAIVNTGSVAGTLAFPDVAAYVAAKHAVVGMTKSIAIENAALGIRVNCLNPGGVKTEMLAASIAANPEVERIAARTIPMGRMAEPIELAEAACWLLSDAASFVTGSIFAVDGGQSAGLMQ